MTTDSETPPAEAARPRFDAAKARAKAEFILSRIYGLVRDPKAEWLQIRDEETTIQNILIGYVAPLAAVPPVCDLIGRFVFGDRIGNEVIRPHIDQALISGVLTFLVSIALVFLIGLVINAIAENFDSERNDLAAQKVAAYSMTPAFASGVFSLWPGTWWVSIIAVGYAAFLFYRGLPILMKTPEDRAVGYAATVAIAGAVALILLFSLTGCVVGMAHV